MSRVKPPNPDFLNGVPELLVLRLLDRAPMHGYEVVRAIARETGDALTFGEGCIYPILHRLERNGLLAAAREAVGNRTRIVYRLTDAGRERLRESITAWEAVVRAVNQALQGGNDADTRLA